MIPAKYDALIEKLRSLPDDRRAMLVVRSMPFGAIVEDDTRVEHGVVEKDYAYAVCRRAKQ